MGITSGDGASVHCCKVEQRNGKQESSLQQHRLWFLEHCLSLCCQVLVSRKHSTWKTMTGFQAPTCSNRISNPFSPRFTRAGCASMISLEAFIRNEFKRLRRQSDKWSMWAAGGVNPNIQLTVQHSFCVHLCQKSTYRA